MSKGHKKTNQPSLSEINGAIEDFKAWTTDAKNALHADKFLNHINRLAFLFKNNAALNHIIRNNLPNVDIQPTVELLEGTILTYWHDLTTPIDWPFSPDERLSTQIKILIAVSEGKINWERLWRCSFGNMEAFWKELFIPFARDFERLLKRVRDEAKHIQREPEKQISMPAKKRFSLDLFISHSSKDENVAKALIEFLRAALAISHERVRCTSVDGYKLSAGVPTELELKREIHESRCFIGLVTPNSLQSSFVLFELGARWGAGSHLIPVLARGQKASELRPPLSNLNALNSAKSPEMHQLVHELATQLGKKVPLPSAYASQLDILLQTACIT